MKKLRYLLLGASVVAIGVAAGLLYSDGPVAEVESHPAVKHSQTAASVPPEPESASVANASAETGANDAAFAPVPALTTPARLPSAPAADAAASKPKAVGGGGKRKKALQNPEARVALALVGVDPTAEEVWITAINNPGLPANERQDLIEDLNEVGIDPKNLTPDDVPLILSRLQIIEHNLPKAMDEVNAAAFAEAYKDLQKMLGRLK